MEKGEKYYGDIKFDLSGYLQILTRNINSAMSLASERKSLFNKKTKNAQLKRDIHSAVNYAHMATRAFNDLIDLLETRPETVSEYLLEQKRLKSLEPQVYKAMAKRGIIELDENGEPKEWKMGNIHAYWSELKKLMKKEYDVDWKSPADRNPHTRYD